MWRALSLISLIILCFTFAACSQEPDGQASPDADLNDTAPDETLCTGGETRCDGPDTVEVCTEDGESWTQQACPQGQSCSPSTGACSDQICSPGDIDGCSEDGQLRYCDISGTEWVTQACPGGGTCTDGVCSEAQCAPGAARCTARDEVEICSDAGVYLPTTTCPLGTECFDGKCEELCEISTKVSSYMGCEYWSVDLDNYDEALSQPHAIVLTNPNDELPARVQLFEGFSNRQITRGADGALFPESIPPGEARIFSITPGYDHSGTQIFKDKAIRVTSSIPVVAYQFNPLNNVDVFSNDASLLLPTNTLGREYWGLSWNYRGGSVRIRGYLTIVNSSPNQNTVTVTPSAKISAGPTIEALDPGIPRQFTLAPGQSLNLATEGAEFVEAQTSGCLSDPEGKPSQISPCPDLTGTHIKAELPITVFGGHQCANVILGVDRCDHIESILLPVEAWDTNYIASKFFPRAQGSLPEPDFIRVIAAQDNTRIQTDPPIENIHNRRLNAGEWVQFPTLEHVEIVADKPIQMAQYMVGANWLGIPRVCKEGLDSYNPTGIGDPAMSVAVPTEQYRDNYIIHIPENYQENYINIITPAGQDVRLNGQPIPASQWQVVGTRNRFEVATLQLDTGFYTLDGDSPFGTMAYGYDCHVSYAYPGGLNLEPRDSP